MKYIIKKSLNMKYRITFVKPRVKQIPLYLPSDDDPHSRDTYNQIHLRFRDQYQGWLARCKYTVTG